MNQRERIREFLAGEVFAVAGASADRGKFGNKVLRAYLGRGLIAYPVNPHEEEIEGQTVYPDLASLPKAVHGLSIVTPPPVTEELVAQAADAGVPRVWMQPGADSPAAVARAEEAGLEPIHGGPCVLVELPRARD